MPDKAQALRDLRIVKIKRLDQQAGHAALVAETADAVRRAHQSGLTAIQIAEAVGVTRQQVSNYINGKTSPDKNGASK